MIGRHPNIWKWLPICALGAMLLGAFGPLPDPVDRILGGLGAVLLLAYYGAVTREERRERQADQSSSAAISSSDQT